MKKTTETKLMDKLQSLDGIKIGRKIFRIMNMKVLLPKRGVGESQQAGVHIQFMESLR